MSLYFRENADQLAAHIKRLSEYSEKPFVVAIDGRSGSGKSTLADRLKNCLDAIVISGDDFFAGGISLRDDSPDVLAQICIDWRTQKYVLNSLLSSGYAEYFPFDWNAFDGSKSSGLIKLKAQPVIILEGVYSARSELRELCDTLVLLEIKEEVRNRQLLEREDEIGDWEKQWHKAEDWYFLNSSPRSIFNIVVS